MSSCSSSASLDIQSCHPSVEHFASDIVLTHHLIDRCAPRLDDRAAATCIAIAQPIADSVSVAAVSVGAVMCWPHGQGHVGEKPIKHASHQWTCVLIAEPPTICVSASTLTRQQQRGARVSVGYAPT